jgi:hypothetical protein
VITLFGYFFLLTSTQQLLKPRETRSSSQRRVPESPLERTSRGLW